MRKVKQIPSRERLARACSVSRQTINKWMEDRLWRWGHAPWKASDVPAILQFARARQRRSDDPAVAGAAIRGAMGGKGFSKDLSDLTPLERASISVKLETAASRKLDREIKLGKYHLADECDRKMLMKIYAIKNALLTLPNGDVIDGIMATDNEHHARAILRLRIEEMLLAFAGCSSTGKDGSDGRDKRSGEIQEGPQRGSGNQLVAAGETCVDAASSG